MSGPSAPDSTATAGDSPALELEDVTVRYGEQTVLDEVSLTVRRGEFLALVGPNGAGKTTLLRVVNGLVTPDAGTVRIAGTESETLSVRERARRVATVPQETHVGFDFPVRDLVAMGRTAHGSRFSRADTADRVAVERALERTETTVFADRSVGSLSGGERQRVVLARALAQGAPLLLLDEPTASLDINHQVRVLELVHELVAGRGDDANGTAPGESSGASRTAVAAIHDLDLAARFCDRVALLAEGGIQTVGSPETVLTDERLAAAYGVEAVVTENDVTGAPTVTALGKRDVSGTADAERRPDGPPRLEADDD